MEFKNPYEPEYVKISTLQRWILVHSFLYYEMDSSLVSDETFDGNAKQLVLMQKNKVEAMKSEYWYVFFDFEGNTGFDLIGRLNKNDREYLYKIASNVLATYRRNHNVKNKKA